MICHGKNALGPAPQSSTELATWNSTRCHGYAAIIIEEKRLMQLVTSMRNACQVPMGSITAALSFYATALVEMHGQHSASNC